MKIIGGKKDYFDYLVSYYGYDDHLVWDRRNKGALNYKGADNFIFHICGQTIPVLKKKDVFIFSPDSPLLTNSWNDHYDREWMRKWHQKPSKLNAELRQPVLCETGFYNSEPFVPCLSDFGFASHIDANEMYQRIYAFLGWLKDNPAPPDNQTDKEKIVSHGFDKRTSFRPLIKNP